MQRFTTVLKQSPTMGDQSTPQYLSSRTNVYVKNSMSSAKSSNESSSGALTTTNSESSDNNETVTLTNSNALAANNSPRYRPTGRRFFSGKSKSAAVSRSASNTSRILNAEKIYIQNSSEDQLSTSETDDLNSDDDDKLVYKTCLESQPPPSSASKSIYLKKSVSRPECAIKSSYQYSSSAEKSDSGGRRFVKESRLRTSKSMSHCKNAGFQNDDDDDEEEEANEEEPEEETEADEQSSLYYRQLDGRMKKGRLSRFKLIKSKSNSALQSVRNNLNRKYDYPEDTKSLAKQPIKGTQKNDQITNQVQLNELAERLKFIEQKLLENEMNTEKKLQNMTNAPTFQSTYPNNQRSQPYSYLHQNNSNYSQQQSPNYSYIAQQNSLQNGLQNGYSPVSGQKNSATIGPNFLSNNSSNNSNTLNTKQINSNNSKNNLSKQNQDDFCLKNGQLRTRIYPSISFGDCSEIHILQPKKSLKRHFFSSAIKNSKSLVFLPSKDKNEKSSVDKISSLPGSGVKTSASKIWKPFNILGSTFNNLIDTVDDKVLKGRWHSSKSVKSSSSSNSVRSNSICSASSNLPNSRRTEQSKPSTENKPLYGPIFNKRKDTSKSLSSKFINNLSLMGQSRKNSQYSANSQYSTNSQYSANNQSNASSSGDLARSTGSNASSRFSSTKQLDVGQPDCRNQLTPNSGLKPQKARAYSTPNEEIFNLLSLPFMEEDGDCRRSVNEESLDCKQPRCYKEINSKALLEIEAFEKLLSDKFTIAPK